MLLCVDPTQAEADLLAGALACPHRRCDGQLGPWGHARARRTRVSPGRVEAHRPRRARCRSCRRTQVLLWARSYPRRPDAVEVVGAALVKASDGLGYRQVAAEVGLPASTVRGWLQRARANADAVRSAATRAVHALDANAGAIHPSGSALGDMLEAVGRAIAAAIRRVGPTAAPWQLGVVITGAGILSRDPPRAWVL